MSDNRNKNWTLEIGKSFYINVGFCFYPTHTFFKRVLCNRQGVNFNILKILILIWETFLKRNLLPFKRKGSYNLKTFRKDNIYNWKIVFQTASLENNFPWHISFFVIIEFSHFLKIFMVRNYFMRKDFSRTKDVLKKNFHKE